MHPSRQRSNKVEIKIRLAKQKAQCPRQRCVFPIFFSRTDMNQTLHPSPIKLFVNYRWLQSICKVIDLCKNRSNLNAHMTSYLTPFPVRDMAPRSRKPPNTSLSPNRGDRFEFRRQTHHAKRWDISLLCSETRDPIPSVVLSEYTSDDDRQHSSKND